MLTLRSNGFSTLWLALALAISGCGGGGGSGGGSKDGPGPVDPKPLAELVSIQVSPEDESLPAGVSQQYTATGVYADDTTDDITDEVAWQTADSDIASISSSGMVKGELAGGPIKISATIDSITGETSVTVSNATLTSLDITPPTASIPAGMTQEFVATGTYSDGSTLDISSLVSWESSDADVATVDANGVASALVKNAGITITATLDSASDTANLTVTDATLQSIEVTPSAFELAAGYEHPYEATGLLSDGSTIELTDAATWSSSDETVATVGNESTAGQVKGVAKGTANIQAAFEGKTGGNELKVTDAELLSIAVSADDTSLAAGYKQTYTAEGTYSDSSTQDLSTQVLWSVSDDELARISNDDASKSEVTALVAGGPLD
ncbi:MAG: Ig-like domain-containing protein, partial [Panacagrimonas sp.]